MGRLTPVTARETARQRRDRLIDAYVYQEALPETDYRERLAVLDREIDADSGFGTSETCLLFSGFQTVNDGEARVVARTGFEPVLPT